MSWRLSLPATLLLAVLGAACAQDTDEATLATGPDDTAIMIGSDGQISLDGRPVAFEQIDATQFTDTVRVLADGATSFAQVDSLLRFLHSKGVQEVGLQVDEGSGGGSVHVSLIAPMLEVTLFQYNVLHVTVATDSLLIVRGAAPETELGVVADLSDIIDRAVARHENVTVGVGVRDGVDFRTFWPVLRALEQSTARGVAVHAPVPGYVRGDHHWDRPREGISIVYYEPWRGQSEWRGASESARRP